ncbi:MAG: hypothetical protein IJ725_04900, partial [Ruminococcus sp.]|nr:hypothetical protein [Ruminococcus sp.]
SSFTSTYQYKSNKKRNIMAFDIPTNVLTNHDRIEVGIPFKNAYKEDGTHTNSRYLMKVTAYIRDKGSNDTFDSDDNIMFSNSMYVCLDKIAAQELAVHGENSIICESIK